MGGRLEAVGIAFLLNGEEVSAIVRPDQTALELLRDDLGLTGTREACSEGDCGACTVALGRLEGRKVVYRAVNSCLLPAPRLHGTHLLTVEGLAQGEELHKLQKAILDHHATQCGYCTPGILLSLFCLFSQRPAAGDAEIRIALEGNLCRCTGYEAVLDAARSVADHALTGAVALKERLLPVCARGMERRLAALTRRERYRPRPDREGRLTVAYHTPRSLEELFDALEEGERNGGARLLAGATDVGVEANVKRMFSSHLVDITRVPELDGLVVGLGRVRIGASLTLARLLESRDVRRALPSLCQAMSAMGSAQVRNVATLAGNVANASPIGDAAVALLGLGAVAILLSREGERRVPLEEFFQGYRRTALRPKEVLAALDVPIPNGYARFEKTSRRLALDISTVNSHLLLEQEEGRVTRLRFALGGVAPTPVLCPVVPVLLEGRPLDRDAFREAAEAAAEWIVPISDVRGSAEYRRLLVRNHLGKHLDHLLGVEEASHV